MNKPALWAKANDVTRREIRKLSEEFAHKLGKMSGRCLDVGSGPGDVVIDFILPKLNPNASLVCADISEEMLNFAKKRYRDNQRVSFMKLDIESPNLSGDLAGKFDHVTSEYCLHWCHDVRQSLKNIFNLLRPGGSVFLAFLANVNVYDTWEALATIPQYQPYMKKLDRYVTQFHHDKQQLETLEALLDGVGFKTHHCSCRQNVYPLGTIGETETYVLSADPFIDGMPPNLREVYRKDLVKQFTNNSNTSDVNYDDESYSRIIYRTFVVYVTKPATK